MQIARPKTLVVIHLTIGAGAKTNRHWSENKHVNRYGRAATAMAATALDPAKVRAPKTHSELMLNFQSPFLSWCVRSDEVLRPTHL